MSQSTNTVSPLRQRLIEDMTLRKLSSATQSSYIRAVKQLADYLGRSPARASAEDLRRYQLHLVESGVSRSSINARVTALRFFFGVTLGRSDVAAPLSRVRMARTLPVVLSPEEVARLLRAAPKLKYKAALSLAYGAGLRAGEVVALKVSDIDGERMVLRIEQGKGRKDRYAMLSPKLLQLLRVWWRVANAHGKMLPGGWLFPGRNPVKPLTPSQLRRAVHAAARAAAIDKRVSVHTLRHYSGRRIIPSRVGMRSGSSRVFSKLQTPSPLD